MCHFSLLRRDSRKLLYAVNKVPVHTHTHTHTHIYIYIYILCVCVCVCMCVLDCSYYVTLQATFRDDVYIAFHASKVIQAKKPRLRYFIQLVAKLDIYLIYVQKWYKWDVYTRSSWIFAFEIFRLVLSLLLVDC